MIYKLQAMARTMRLKRRLRSLLAQGANFCLHPNHLSLYLDLLLRASQGRGAAINGDGATLDVKPSMCRASQAVRIMISKRDDNDRNVHQNIRTGNMTEAGTHNNDVARIWIHCN